MSITVEKDRMPQWGAKGIAPVINRTVRQTFRALESGSVPGAKKIAGRWMIVPAIFHSAVAAPNAPKAPKTPKAVAEQVTA